MSATLAQAIEVLEYVKGKLQENGDLRAQAKEAALKVHADASKPFFGADGGFLNAVLSGAGGEKLAAKFGYANTLENHFNFIKDVQVHFGSDPSYIAAKQSILDLVLA